MVLTYDEQTNFAKMKHEFRKELAAISHQDKLEELQKELEIAKVHATGEGN